MVVILPGTDAAPHANLLACLVNLLGRLDEVERMGLEFLRNTHDSLGRIEMEVLALYFLRPQEPVQFYLVYRANDSRLWYVRFEDGRPKIARMVESSPNRVLLLEFGEAMKPL